MYEEKITAWPRGELGGRPSGEPRLLPSLTGLLCEQKSFVYDKWRGGDTAVIYPIELGPTTD